MSQMTTSPTTAPRGHGAVYRRARDKSPDLHIDVGGSGGMHSPVGFYRRLGWKGQVTMLIAVLLLVWHTDMLQTPVRVIRSNAFYLAQSNAFNTVRLAVSPGARATQKKAEAYYRQQWPLILESLKTFKVHWYFAESVPPPLETVTWYEMVHARIRSMARLLREEKRDDFRVEKDRCEMYRFFNRSGLPHPRVAGYWYNITTLKSALVDGSAYSEVRKWPAFLKACHLTQGPMKAVLLVPSYDWALKNSHEVLEWINTKLTVRADDWSRPWRNDGNSLTDALQPGLMVQDSFHVTYNPYMKKKTPIELKVEVLWGRAYLAVSSDLHTGTQFMRDYTMDIFPTSWDQVMYSASHEIEPQLSWVLQKDYMDCVFDLSERAAKIIAAESVRIDIFMWEGHPDQCTINEISLSSGMSYGMHFPYLAKTWAEPLVTKTYNLLEDRQPVYLRTKP